MRTVSHKSGFTFLEVMLAFAILAVVMGMAMFSFSSVVKAWQRGGELSKTSSHADFIMEQLVNGLRSSYFPDSAHHGGLYGFWLEDEGDGVDSRDTISWVKMGYDLTYPNNPEVRGPHRVLFSREDIPGISDKKGVGVRIWQVYGKDEDFEPEDQRIEILSDFVEGFNCRVATNLTEEGWEWLDEWEEDQTNMLPAAIELTLYMSPPEEGEDPIQVQRLIEVPIAHLSWSHRNRRSGASAPGNLRERLRQRIRDRQNSQRLEVPGRVPTGIPSSSPNRGQGR